MTLKERWWLIVVQVMVVDSRYNYGRNILGFLEKLWKIEGGAAPNSGKEMGFIENRIPNETEGCLIVANWVRAN